MIWFLIPSRVFVYVRSDTFRSFVDYCLLKIPQDRPSSGELLRVSGFTVTSLPVPHQSKPRASLMSHSCLQLPTTQQHELCPLLAHPHQEQLISSPCVFFPLIFIITLHPLVEHHGRIPCVYHFTATHVCCLIILLGL